MQPARERAVRAAHDSATAERALAQMFGACASESETSECDEWWKASDATDGQRERLSTSRSTQPMLRSGRAASVTAAQPSTESARSGRMFSATASRVASEALVCARLSERRLGNREHKRASAAAETCRQPPRSSAVRQESAEGDEGRSSSSPLSSCSPSATASVSLVPSRWSDASREQRRSASNATPSPSCLHCPRSSSNS
mmetsp:Transcript_26762/g.57811  ORF Transcript_26762/g.57811 Transcript_26762/m.57811 type:complete len:201 (+) Transcript_26762:464-1066(+)